MLRVAVGAFGGGDVVCVFKEADGDGAAGWAVVEVGFVAGGSELQDGFFGGISETREFFVGWALVIDVAVAGDLQGVNRVRADSLLCG